MARLLYDPNQFPPEFFKAVTGAVSSLFPVEGPTKRLEVSNLVMGDSDPDDYAGQYDAKMFGKTVTSPLRGDVQLIDKASGKVLSEAKGRVIARVPTPTDRMTFIVGGSEYAGKMQTRLKSGPYTRLRETGEAETDFNLKRGQNFKLIVNPREEKVRFHLGGASYTPKAFFQGLGVPEKTGRKIFGDQLWDLNTKSDNATEVEVTKLHTKIFGEPGEKAERRGAIQEYFETATEVREDTTKRILGKAFSTASPEMIQLAAKRTMDLAAGRSTPDVREDLHFKTMHGPEDVVSEVIRAGVKGFQKGVMNRMSRRDDLDQIIPATSLSARLSDVISGSSGLFERSEQYNQLQAIAGASLSNPLGFGGITNTRQITRGMRQVYPTHYPIFDTANSPEGERTGINKRLSVLAVKDGENIRVPMFDRKDKKVKLVTATDLANDLSASRSAMKVDGKAPLDAAQVRAVGANGIHWASAEDVRYVSPHSGASIVSAAIPFIQHNSPNRVMITGRHMEQSVSLAQREIPRVQSRWPSVSPSSDVVRGTDEALGHVLSRVSTVAGTVTKVGDKALHIKDTAGKTHKIQLAKYLPFNELKAHLTHTSLVKAGDEVKKGQTVADSQNTKDGEMALGIHLRTALMPYRGLNFEDGVVISEGAAEKLTSDHSYLKRKQIGADTKLNRAAFTASFPELFTAKQLAGLDSRGVAKLGTVLHYGDPIVAATAPSEKTREHVILKGIKSSLIRPHKPDTLIWESPYPGIVTDVSYDGKDVRVSAVTSEPMQVGDKVSTRSGSKAIVVSILPDEEMPRDESGTPLEMLYNSAGIPGRLNPGLLYEMALGKASRESGTRYIIDNFSPDGEPDKRVYKIVDVKAHWRARPGEGKSDAKPIKVKGHTRITEHAVHDLTQQELSEAGMKDEERIFDPVLGKHYDNTVLVGDAYWMKLAHQIDKKKASRGYGGAGVEYDTSMVPKGGGKHGGQSLGILGLYSMLAHGAGSNLAEMYGSRSDVTQDAWWSALMAGQAPPPSKTPFVVDRFHAYLKALRVSPERDNDMLRLLPMTDEDVEKLSRGDLTDPSQAVHGKNLKPITGGLFDEKITGGISGSGWASIKLPAKVPHPLFEGAIQALMGITSTEYEKLLDGDSWYGPGGYAEDEGPGRLTGVDAIVRALSDIDPAADSEQLAERIKTARKTELDKLVKRYKYLRALAINGKRPEDVYLMGSVPVLPPVFRPMTELPSGDLNIGDLNTHYKTVGVIVGSMANKGWDDYSPELKRKLYGELRRVTAELFGTRGGLTSGTDPDKGIAQLLGGVTSPKEGFFLKKVLGRRLDMTGRSTIIPDINLGLDEIGIPFDMAFHMFRPLVVREMVRRGYKPADATIRVEKRDGVAEDAMRDVVSRWLVLGKRDPSLDKYNVLAGRPKIVGGSAIRINPLWTGPLGADFDGDTVSSLEPLAVSADYSSADPAQVESLLQLVYPGLSPQEVSEMFPDTTKVLTTASLGLVMALKDLPRGEPVLDSKVPAWVPGVPLSVGAFDPATGSVRLFPVSEISDHGDLQKVVVRMRNSGSVEVSPDHSLAIWDISTMEVRKATPAECSVGTCIPVAKQLLLPSAGLSALPLPAGAGTKMRPVVALNRACGYYLGCSVGDGWVSMTGENTSQVHLANTDDGIEAAWRLSLKEFVLGEPHITKTSQPHTFKGHECFSQRLTFSCSALGAWTRGVLGHGVENKRLPSFALAAPEEFRLGLLAGLLDTDGTAGWRKAASKKNRQFMVQLTTKSSMLSKDIQALCLSLGVRAGITESPRKKDGKVYTYWVVTFSSVDIYGLDIELHHTQKRAALGEYQEMDLPESSVFGSAKLDLVPYPPVVHAAVKAAAVERYGSTYKLQKSENKSDATLYVASAKAAKDGYTTRLQARKNIAWVGEEELPAAWLHLVENEDTTWDPIGSVEFTDERIPMMDLTVPGSWTFMLANGAVVWDSMRGDHEVWLYDSETDEKYLSRIDEVPRESALERTDNVTFYGVPENIFAMALGPDGKARPYPIRDYSEHADVEEFEVRFLGGTGFSTVYVGGGHSLAVFDHDTCAVRACAAGEAEPGMFSPMVPELCGDSQLPSGEDLVPVPLYAADRVGKALGLDLDEVMAGIPRKDAKRVVKKSWDPTGAWRELIANKSVMWSVIRQVSLTNQRVRMYDLTVPGAWTMILDDGLVVWDSVSGPLPYQDADGSWVADIAKLATADPTTVTALRYGDMDGVFAETSGWAFSTHPGTARWEARTKRGRSVVAAAGKSLIGYAPETLAYGLTQPDCCSGWYVPIPRALPAAVVGEILGHAPTPALGVGLGAYLAGGEGDLPEAIREALASGKIPGMQHSDEAFRRAVVNGAARAHSASTELFVTLNARDELCAYALSVVLRTFGVDAVPAETLQGWVLHLSLETNDAAKVLFEGDLVGALDGGRYDAVPFPTLLAAPLQRLGAELGGFLCSIEIGMLPREKAIELAQTYRDEIHGLFFSPEAGTVGPAVPGAVALGSNFLRMLALDCRWDRYASSKRLPAGDTYDLTVMDPLSPTFTMASGLPVQDTMSIFVPATDAAVAEARKLLPSANALRVNSGAPVFQPSLEASYGLFMLTLGPPGTGAAKKAYKTAAEAAADDTTPFHAAITVGGTRTTRGRAALYDAVPEELRGDYAKLLSDPEFRLNKKETNELVRRVAVDANAKFPQFMDRIKMLGFNTAQVMGTSFGLKDIKAVPGLKKIVEAADVKVRRATRGLPPEQRAAVANNIYAKALGDVQKAARKHAVKTGNRLFLMGEGGIKSWDQVRQFFAPLVHMRETGAVPVSVSINGSWGQGMDGMSYLAASAGGVSGLISKTQSVAAPGALTKELNATVMDVRIEPKQYGVRKPYMVPITDIRGLEGRFTAQAVSAKGIKIPVNTALTPKLIRGLRTAGVQQVPIRSPIYSEAPRGIDARDWGLNPGEGVPDSGTLVGVLAAQALGERGVNLSMKQVHLASAGGQGGSVLSGMDLVSKLLHMPRNDPGYAVLAEKAAKVTKITPASAGGHNVFLGEDRHYVPAYRELSVKAGDSVTKGGRLSDGQANPREVLRLKGIDATREYLVESLYDIYKPEGIYRRNVEVLVRGMTDSVRIDDPGDAPFIRGETATESAIRRWSREHPSAAQPKYEHVLHGVNMAPHHVIEDVVGRMGFQRIRSTVANAALEGQATDLGGDHPIPRVIYGKPAAGAGFAKSRRTDL